MTFPFPWIVPRSAASVTYTDSEYQDSASTVYTFTGKAIGTAGGHRVIVVGVAGASTTSRTISSVTVGGIAATQIVFAEDLGNSLYTPAGLFIARVPTGTTANVVVTWSGGQSRCGVGVWAVYNLDSIAATGTNSSLVSPSSLNLTIPPGGVAIGMFSGYDNNSFSAHTWVGLTKNFDLATVATNQVGDSGASLASAAGAVNLTITCTMNGASPDSTTGVSAAFR